MNKRVLVVAAAAAMLAMIAGAFVVDCMRLAEAARRRAALADQELVKHEQRLVKLLIGTGLMTEQVKSAINAYLAADAAPERHEAYEKVVAAFRQTMQTDFDPTDPLDRKFMDDVAGAINRRERAEPPYEAEAAAYREYLSGTRGAVARRFSAQARGDWNAN
jgi:hypothetical protein